MLLRWCSAKAQSWPNDKTHHRVDASKAASLHPGCFTVGNLGGVAARKACCLLQAAAQNSTGLQVSTRVVRMRRSLP